MSRTALKLSLVVLAAPLVACAARTSDATSPPDELEATPAPAAPAASTPSSALELPAATEELRPADWGDEPRPLYGPGGYFGNLGGYYPNNGGPTSPPYGYGPGYPYGGYGYPGPAAPYPFSICSDGVCYWY